jgi:hypothetical protein
MLMQFAAACRRHALGAAVALAAGCAAAPAMSQPIRTIDPNAAVNSDLGPAPRPQAEPAPVVDDGVPIEGPAPAAPAPSFAAAPAGLPPVSEAQRDTYREDDLIGAAEGVFGKGAQGLANIIKDILKKQGEPNAYIVGREAGGAFVLGARYGSGTLYHKVEGQKAVYWTGPSVGFDAGANAGSTFVLVYNLYNTDDLYKRFPAGEGQLYFVGGFNASYVRKGNIVLIPIRVGAGLRLGVNAGYMKFTRKQTWLPF